MPTVYFVKQGVAVECAVGTNLRALALQHGISLYSFPNNLVNCLGNGLCGTCRIKVDNPNAVSVRTRSDESKCAWEGLEYRLSCQSKVLADVQVITNPRKKAGWMAHPTYQWMQNLD